MSDQTITDFHGHRKRIGPTNGYLVPFRSIEGRKQEFVDFCKRNLPPKKTKGLKA